MSDTTLGLNHTPVRDTALRERMLGLAVDLAIEGDPAASVIAVAHALETYVLDDAYRSSATQARRNAHPTPTCCHHTGGTDNTRCASCERHTPPTRLPSRAWLYASAEVINPGT